MKTIIVFGGSGVIGSEVCRTLKKDNVIVYSADIKDLPTQYHRDEFITCNICNPFSLEHAFNKVKEKYGSIDAIVNCAYVKSPYYGKEPWKYTRTQDMCGFFAANWGSCVDLIKTALHYEVKNIVVLSSMYGKHLPDEWMYDGTNVPKTPLEYACTKAALNQMVRYLAKEGIHINAIAPGGIEDNQDLQFKENYKGVAPFTTPGDIADMVDYLLSEKGNQINGQIITVDGGFSL